MAEWLNADGLRIDLGITEAKSQDVTNFQSGEYKTFGANRVTETTIDLIRLAGFGTATILGDNTFFGAGWVPEMIEIETLVAVTGATATLSVGLVRNSDRTTAISGTAFVNAVTVASIAAVGTRLTIVAGSTGAGANIGVATTFDALMTATAGTANFTAGRIKVRVSWRPTVNL